MAIDSESTITALAAAIDDTHLSFAVTDAGLPATLTGTQRDNAVANVPPRPEIAEARAVLTSLEATASKYFVKWGPKTAAKPGASDTWAVSYEEIFKVLDRHVRYVLSLTTTAPSALDFAADQATHDTLVTRSNSAASSGADAGALADLATFRTRFDTTWAQKPSSTVTNPSADSSAEGVALSAAIATATQTIAFLAWAKANPS